MWSRHLPRNSSNLKPETAPACLRRSRFSIDILSTENRVPLQLQFAGFIERGIRQNPHGSSLYARPHGSASGCIY
jgi:hypothetical protein